MVSSFVFTAGYNKLMRNSHFVRKKGICFKKGANVFTVVSAASIKNNVLRYAMRREKMFPILFVFYNGGEGFIRCRRNIKDGDTRKTLCCF